MGRVCGVCVVCECEVRVGVCVFVVWRGTVGWRAIEDELDYVVFFVLYFDLLCCIGQ